MWTVCITSISHVLKLNGYGGPQAKVNEKRLCFKGWETLVIIIYTRIKTTVHQCTVAFLIFLAIPNAILH